MRTTLALTADPSEWLTQILRRLQPWAMATGILACSPATDTLGLSSAASYMAPFAMDDGSSVALEQQLTYEEKRSLYIAAQTEASNAQSMLRGLSFHLELDEVKAYVDAIYEVLGATSDVTSLNQTQLFTFGLQAARIQLLESTSSLKLWLKVAQVVVPDAEFHRVPERFVKRDIQDDEEPLVFSETAIDARSLVGSFLGQDADSPASHA